MGTFFFMSAVRTTDVRRLERELREIAGKQGFDMVPAKPAEFEDWIAFSTQRGAWTCVQYQQSALDWPEVTRSLSASLASPAFYFEIYDGETWGYRFFEEGRELAKYVSMPAVHEEASDEPDQWTGNIQRVADRLGLTDSRALEQYLVHLDPENPLSEKADPEDEFELSDPWVISDFIRRLDIQWDDQEPGGATHCLVKRR